MIFSNKNSAEHARALIPRISMKSNPSSNIIKEFEAVSKLVPFKTDHNIQLSHDQSYIVSSFQSKLQFFDIKKNQLKEDIFYDEDPLTCFSLSPDDKIIVTGNSRLVIRIWDVKSSKPLHSWKSTGKKPIIHMDIDSTVTIIAMACLDGTIRLYDLSKRYYVNSLKGNIGTNSFVKFYMRNNTNLLFSTSTDHAIHVWDIKTGKNLHVLSDHTAPITCIQVYKDKNIFISSGRDNSLNIYDLDHFVKTGCIILFENIECFCPISSGYVSKYHQPKTDQIFICTAGSSGVINVWAYPPSKCIHKIDLFEIPKSEDISKTLSRLVIRNMFLLTDPPFLLVTTYSGEYIFVDMKQMTKTRQICTNLGEVYQIVPLNDTTNSISVISDSQILRILDGHTLDCTEVLYGHKDTILCLASAFNIIVTGSKDNCIRVWSKTNSSYHCTYTGTGHVNSVTAVVISALKEDFFVVSCSEDNTIKKWKIPSKKSSREAMSLSVEWSQIAHEKSIDGIDISKKNEFIATVSSDKTIKLWSVDGKLLATLVGHRRAVNCLAFSPIDRLLATGSLDCTIRLWSLSTFTCVKTLEESDSSITTLKFINNGEFIIAGHSNGIIKIWNIAENTIVSSLDVHQEKIWALCTTEDSMNFYSGDADGCIILWRDVTEETKMAIQKKQDEYIENEQKLANLIENGEIVKAFSLSLYLNHPLKLYNLLAQIINTEAGVDSLKDIVLQLKPDQLNLVLKYASKWNTNFRYYLVSQKLLNIIFTNISYEVLKDLSEFSLNLNSLLPYSERHFKRIDKYVENISFIDFMRSCMKIT